MPGWEGGAPFALNEIGWRKTPWEQGVFHGAGDQIRTGDPHPWQSATDVRVTRDPHQFPLVRGHFD